MHARWRAHQPLARAHQQRRGRHYVALRLACVLLLAPLLAGCLARPSGDATDSQRGATITKRRDLQKLPEEHLFYPGAVVTRQFGHDQQRTIEGTNHAVSGYMLAVNAGEEEVFDFYRRELAARGWHESPIDIVSVTNQLDVVAWRKGELVFRLAILRKNDPRNPQAGDAYATPYSIYVIVQPQAR